MSFKAYSTAANLKESESAMMRSGKYDSHPLFLLHAKASQHNFIRNISSYTIVHIFSHAASDPLGNETALYVYDCAIHLSQLQLIHQPATDLIVLSACQTNVGKRAMGEGIFSLATGFFLAGIPSVAATLWDALERPIYVVSKKFTEKLPTDMAKDEALQKAKLDFIHAENEKTFPYYWANSTLVGNVAPIQFSQTKKSGWWLAILIIVIAGVISIVLISKKQITQYG